jgi:outer membrane protein
VRLLTTILLLACASVATVTAQKIGYVSTSAIRERFPENKAAEQKLQTLVEEWKAEIQQKQKDVEELELEMKKNRLIWSDAERQQHDRELEQRRKERDKLARDRFEPGGDYDKQAKGMFGIVNDKIYAAVQKVAANDGYDIVWDKSTDPLVYVNPKFDLTVKVMQALGIDAEDLDRKQKEAIENDPRNQRTTEPRSRKSRRSTNTEEATPPKQDPKQFTPNVIPQGADPNATRIVPVDDTTNTQPPPQKDPP